MATQYPKKLNGLCVGILSGDRVLFQGPPDVVNGGYKQKILHLSGIQSPKVDTVNGNDQKFGFAARQFLRKRLVGKNLPFVIQKKVNEIELGYITYEGKDITIDLLSKGYAKMRGQNIKCDHIDQYKDAQEEATMAQVGVWSLDSDKPQDAYRYLRKNGNEKQLAQKYKGQSIKGIVEQIHPSKAHIYFPKEGIITVLNFSEVQVVVLSQKINNQTKTSNVRTIRSVLQSCFLQKQVNVVISGYTQNLNGYLVNQNEEDVRKVLLKNGFAKLGKDAMTGLSTKQFMELKTIAQSALNQGKGLWKQQQVNKSQTLNEKSYNAVVLQVNSGDSLTVFNSQKNTTTRVFLPNTRAPSVNQPYCFEAKQALRKRIIGQKVRVQVEFSRKINVKTNETGGTQQRNLVFASIFQNNQNVSVYLLENGFINLQTPRVEQDVSKYFQNLRQAEAKGKKQKRGMYKGEYIKVPSFNDVSGGKGKKIDTAKAKNLFPFLKDEKNLKGVIDLVLNGSRFKIRFNNPPVMAIFVLEGVRALPNQGQYKKASQQALQYSKLHALQRDVQIELKKVDLKGVYQGSVLINKRDYAQQLLEGGYAVAMGGKYANKKYQQAESIAKKNKLGLWKYNLDLSILKGETQRQYKNINLVKTGTIGQVISRNQFYIQSQYCQRPDVPQNPKPVDKIAVGGLYAAEFQGVYYRARVVRQIQGKYRVVFIDYGNYDTVAKEKVGLLPQNMKLTKPAVYKCSLYGIDSITDEGQNVLKDLVGAKIKVEFKQESEPVVNQQIDYKVILWQKQNCVNSQLLEYGDAQCTTTIQKWVQAQEKAKMNRQGKWANDQ